MERGIWLLRSVGPVNTGAIQGSGCPGCCRAEWEDAREDNKKQRGREGGYELIIQAQTAGVKTSILNISACILSCICYLCVVLGGLRKRFQAAQLQPTCHLA